MQQLFLICFVILVCCFFLLRLIFLPLLRIARTNRRLLKEGLEAEAIVLSIEKTGVHINKKPQVKLQVQVQPHTSSSFVSEIRQVMRHSALRKLQSGNRIKVKYNPANTTEVMILH